MGRLESPTIPLPVQEEEGEEIRYLADKLCRLCELTKPIPEQDDVCEDCWALRMAGRAVVTCPFYLFEVQDPNVPDGRVPIELCYSCSFRSGWTEDLGPICNHPFAVDIVKRWEVEWSSSTARWNQPWRARTASCLLKQPARVADGTGASWSWKLADTYTAAFRTK